MYVGSRHLTSPCYILSPHIVHCLPIERELCARLPGISREQENTVWWVKEEDSMVVTDTSYNRPLLTVVVVISTV